MIRYVPRSGTYKGVIGNPIGQSNDRQIQLTNSIQYTLKIWTTSILVSPFIYLFLSDNWDSNFLLQLIVFGLLFSLPSVIAFVFVVRQVNKRPGFFSKENNFGTYWYYCDIPTLCRLRIS